MVAYVAFAALLVVILFTRARQFCFRSLWIVVAFGMTFVIAVEPWTFPCRWLVDMDLRFVVGVILRLAELPLSRLRFEATVVQVTAPAAIVLACYAGLTHTITVLLAAWVWSLTVPSGLGVWLFSLGTSQIADFSSYSL